MQTPLDADPPCEQTDACENITLPQTSFAGGEHLLKLRESQIKYLTAETMVFLLPRNEVLGKVIFSQASVILLASGLAS